MQKSKIYPQVFAAVSASLILIGTGFHIGWASPTLAQLRAKGSDVPVSESQGSWIVSFLLIGTICGSIFGFVMVDKWGRKTTLLLMSFPLCISCLLIAVAKSYWWFYLARFIAGCGNGAILTGIPMYMSEIAEDSVRGGIGTLVTVMLHTGTLIAYTLGPWVSRTTCAAVGAIIPIVYAIIFVWVPESPYYYAMKGIPHKIEKSLTWLRGTPNVIEEVKKIQSNVDFYENQTGTIMELFAEKGNRKALVIMIGLLTCQQFSGITAISAYSTIIFNKVDSGLSASISVIMVGIVKLATAIVVVFLADKVGRKVLLLTSILLCVVFLLGEASYFQLQAIGIDVTTVSWFPFVAMVGYLISNAMGVTTVVMVTISEIFPCEVKAFAMTTASVYVAVAGICTTKLYQIVADTYGIHIACYIFAACSAVSTVFIYFIVPETKRRPLSEIQNELRGISKPMR